MWWKTIARRPLERATLAFTQSNTSWLLLAGYGIHNAVVELDANEPPVADGSAREYCKMIQTAESSLRTNGASRMPSRRRSNWKSGDGDDFVSG